jgi:hypothetical protein
VGPSEPVTKRELKCTWAVQLIDGLQRLKSSGGNQEASLVERCAIAARWPYGVVVGLYDPGASLAVQSESRRRSAVFETPEASVRCDSPSITPLLLTYKP